MDSIKIENELKFKSAEETMNLIQNQFNLHKNESTLVLSHATKNLEVVNSRIETKCMQIEE